MNIGIDQPKTGASSPHTFWVSGDGRVRSTDFSRDETGAVIIMDATRGDDGVWAVRVEDCE